MGGDERMNKYILDKKTGDIKYADGISLTAFTRDWSDWERIFNELNRLNREKDMLSKELWHLRRTKSALKDIKEVIDWEDLQEELEKKENYNIR